MLFKGNKIIVNMFGSNLHIKSVTKIVFTLFLAIILLPLNGLSQTKEVVALKGDGIFRLLTRYGLSSSEYMDDFIALNKSNLGRNNTLLAGVKYKLPDSADLPETPATNATPSKVTGRVVHYDIFGSKYADIEIESNDLKGAVYYICWRPRRARSGRCWATQRLLRLRR